MSTYAISWGLEPGRQHKLRPPSRMHTNMASLYLCIFVHIRALVPEDSHNENSKNVHQSIKSRGFATVFGGLAFPYFLHKYGLTDVRNQVGFFEIGQERPKGGVASESTLCGSHARLPNQFLRDCPGESKRGCCLWVNNLRIALSMAWVFEVGPIWPH